MDISVKSFDNLVHLLYESVATPSRWQLFFDALSQAIRVSTVHLLAFDKKYNSLSYSEGSNIPVDGELAYLQRYSAIDPRFARILTKEVAEWMHCHIEFDDQFVSNDTFYQDFLIPLGRRYASACKLIDDEQAIVLFCLVRDVGDIPLGKAEIAFMERLTPHLERAVRMQLQQYVFSAKALVGHALVNRLKQPVLLTTPEGRVVLENEAAKRLFKSTEILSTEEGTLKLPGEAMRLFINECADLEALAKTGRGSEKELTRYRPLMIKKPGNANKSAEEIVYGFFNLLIPGQVGNTFGLRPLVMLVLFHPASSPPIDSNLLLAAFDLTPAESRLCCLIAEGYALKEIASKIGIQHETVRKQLQSVYRKTSTNRQASLMRLMLHLPDNIFESNHIELI